MPSIRRPTPAPKPLPPSPAPDVDEKNPVKTPATTAPRGVAKMTLESQIPADWRKALAPEFKKPYWKELERFVADERNHFDVLPPPEKVFAALERTPLAKVSVVLLGQDPYPTKGNANGLSFSVEKGMPIPASLRNMFKGLQADVGGPAPQHGDLSSWADQGVLLINTVLTVREGMANSHKEQGWELFTKAILDTVNAQKKPVAFMLLGKQAQEVAEGIDTTRHTVVKAPHPSPLVPGNPFAKAHTYSQVNEALKQAHRKPIDWTLPPA